MDTLQYSNADRLAISYGPMATPNPVPMLSSLSPSSVTAGSAGFPLQVNGVNFVQGATVYFGGQGRRTMFVNATQLNADILSSDISNGGASAVFVFNPLPGGGASSSVEFSVFNPSPAISSINPSSAVAGGAGFTLVVNGSNFVTGSIVNFNATAQSTTYVSSTEVTLAILAGEIANQGTVNITVTNPANGVAGGGTSGPATLTILSAGVQPTIGALVPASATAGAPGFKLAVTGTGFTPSSVVSFNLNNEPTTYVSSTQLQAAIPASAIAVAGTPFVTVANPGGSPPVVATFTVNNPVPGASSLSPSTVPAGYVPAAPLAVTGTNFNTSTTVLVNGIPRATTLVSSSSLNAALPASDFTHSGTLNITVNNPIPGGGTTPALAVVVEDFSVIVPVSSNSVVAGNPASYSLMVTPSNGSTANPVTFSISGLPTGTTPTFSPSPTVPPGSKATTVTLSIATTPHSAAVPIKSPRMPSPFGPSLYLAALAVALMWLNLYALAGRVPRLAPQCLLVSLLLLIVGLIACGGAPGSAAPPVNPATGTPAGTYSVVVTATSSNGSLSTTVTLTVM